MDASTTSSSSSAVFQHSSKPDWGVAALAWDRDGKRGYLFESGELRVLKEGYYHFMIEVDVPEERASKLHEAAEKLNAAPAQSAAPSKKRRGISLDEQFEFFSNEYPGGFAGDKWREEHRARDGRSLKCHRDASVAKAAEVLSKQYLDEGIEADAKKALTAVVKVLASTDLVPATATRALAKGDDETCGMLLQALRAVLYPEEGKFGASFDMWVAALTAAAGEAPKWMIATAPLALAHPQEHVCVRASPFKYQATSMAPRLDLSRRPEQGLYQRALTMATRLRDRAADRELPPADLLDIHDFIRFTMSPKSRKEILSKR